MARTTLKSQQAHIDRLELLLLNADMKIAGLCDDVYALQVGRDSWQDLCKSLSTQLAEKTKAADHYREIAEKANLVAKRPTIADFKARRDAARAEAMATGKVVKL